MSDPLGDVAPNCPSCLHRLEPAGDDPERPWWACPACGWTGITV